MIATTITTAVATARIGVRFTSYIVGPYNSAPRLRAVARLRGLASSQPAAGEGALAGRGPPAARGPGQRGRGTFVGRDAIFYQLEAATRLQHVVVLHGPAGAGKTELAKAFGRWLRDTGGVDNPSWVLVHSFEPGVATFGLDGVITEIGMRLFGSDFAALDADARRAVVQHALADQRILLIWDNFETVRSMPDPAEAGTALDEAGCQELRDFLGLLIGRGRSAVIITSRTREDWLGEVRRMSVGPGAGRGRRVRGKLASSLPCRLAPSQQEGFRGTDGMARWAPAEHALHPSPPGCR